MAENIVIKFIADTSQLESSVDILEKMGQVDKKIVEDFKRINTETKELITNTTAVGAAADTTGKKQAQNAEQTLKATKSLKAELREATADAARLGQEFGKLSPQALQAAKRAAQLRGEIKDTQRNIEALDPGRKLGAFITLGQSATGAIQSLAGGLQLLGLKSEEAAKAGQVLQGTFNVISGIQSIAQLRQAYVGLRAATLAGAAANTTFAASLSATGIGAIVVALGALIGAWVLYKQKMDEVNEVNERFAKLQERIEANAQNQVALFNEAFRITRENEEFQLRLARARGATEEEIAKLKIKRLETEIQRQEKLVNVVDKFSMISDKTYKQQLRDLEKLQQELQIAQAEYENIGKKAESANKKTSESFDLLRVKVMSLNEVIKFVAETISNAFKDPFANLIKGADVAKGKIQELNDALFKKDDERKARNRDLLIQGVGVAAEVAGGILEINNQTAEEETAFLEEQLRNRLISEETYQKRLSKIKQEEAKKNKEAQLFNAFMNAAQAILNALTTPPPGQFAAVAFASALSAINIAKIQAAQIPKFNKGTLSVPGVDQGQDSVLAMLRPGEAVMPVDISKKFRPTLEAMYKGMISASDINAFVSNNAGERGVTKAIVNPYDIKRAFSGGLDIKNADYIAKRIAVEVNQNNIESKVVNRRFN